MTATATPTRPDGVRAEGERAAASEELELLTNFKRLSPGARGGLVEAAREHAAERYGETVDEGKSDDTTEPDEQSFEPDEENENYGYSRSFWANEQDKKLGHLVGPAHSIKGRDDAPVAVPPMPDELADLEAWGRRSDTRSGMGWFDMITRG